MALKSISIRIDEEVANKYNSFKAAYINDEGKVEEVIDASKNDEYITFETTHLSTYSVIGYNAIATEIENPQTGDNIIAYALLGIISIIGLSGASVYMKKRFN